MRKKTKKKTDLDYLKMESGFLVCPVAEDLIDIYEKDKVLYEKLMIKNKKKVKGCDMKEIEKKKIQVDIVKRLHPQVERPESRSSKFYRSKYNALFTDDEQSTRPVTGAISRMKVGLGESLI